MEEENINEELEITIKEKEDEEKSRYKEVIFTVNTGQEAMINFITEKIVGAIECVIIESTASVDIRMALDDFDEIVLYDKKGFIGQKYLSLRREDVYYDTDVSEYTVSKWILNDKLNVTVSNNFNSLVRFIIRYR